MCLVRRSLAALVVVPLLTIVGCGEGKPNVPTSMTEATVKGRVTVNGKPVKSGEVVFDPSNYLRKDAGARTAKIGGDGNFELKTLTGENRVQVRGEALKASGTALRKTYSYDVKTGDNTYDIEVSTK